LFNQDGAMKLQKTTLVLIISALLLGTVVYFYETQGKAEQQEKTQTRKQLFRFTENQITRVTIETQAETLTFEKTGDLPDPWQMKEPRDTTANDAAVVYLLDLLSKSTYQSSFSVAKSQLQNYGLDQPLATVTVALVNGETHRLLLGSESFDESSLYAQVDPQKNSEDPKVFLVPISFKNAVQRDLEEWEKAGSTSASVP
jgi:hypothetical protein